MDETLLQAETDPDADCGHGEAVTNGFRKRMQSIRAAVDERDFYVQKSLHFEKLQGARAHQHSMRINKQWRLIVELKGEAPNKKVCVVSIEDYH
jgi:proteic killer suppression protein